MFRSYEAGRDHVRHDRRQLPAAAGSVRRPELLQARSERRLRDPRHQRRRGGREPDLPVQVPDHQRRQRAQRRRQERGDPAGAERQRRRATRATPPRSTCTRSTRSASSAARAAAARPWRSSTTPRAARRSTSRSTTSAPRRSATTSPTPTSTSTTSAIPGCGTGRVFVGQRKDPFVVNLGETFDLVNIKYPAVGAQPARRVRDRRHAGRQERDVAGPRSADHVPHRRQGRRSSAAGLPPACPARAP